MPILYDLADYVCPIPGNPFLLSSNENCQCVESSDHWRLFLKNKHMEEFYVTDTVIGRGADTSLISSDGVNPVGTFYVQYTGRQYGCAWAARFMAVGQTFRRQAHVVVYTYSGQVIREYDEASDLRLIAHDDTLRLPNGTVVADALSLQWGGEELYFYARNFGLVGWKNLRDGSFGNYLTATRALIQSPFPHVVPRPALFVVPQGYPVGSAPALKQIAFPEGLKLRSAPSLAGNLVRVLRQGESATVYAEPQVSADGYTWRRVTSAQNEQGWSAVSVGGRESFVPVLAWTTRLPVPYVGQTTADAALSDNDCAIACLLMLVRYWLVAHGRSLPSLPTVDDLTRHTVLAESNPPKGLTFAQVEALALALGFPTRYQQPASTDWIKSQLDQNSPVTALVDYGLFYPGHGSFAHFVVVTGYNDTTFLCHDPYFGGAEFSISTERLSAAMHVVPTNSLPDQAFTLKPD